MRVEMDRREGWRNRETRKRKFDDDGSGGGGSPWHKSPGSGQEQPNFPSSPYRPARGAPVLPSGPEMGAVVKWYDPGKGFGFVELEDGSGDAFLHVSVVERLGTGVPAAGAPMRVRIGRGPKGPQVTEITDLGAAPANAPQGGGRRPPQATATYAAGQEIRGTVKWYNAQKGFGFITPEGGGKDVFVHASALGRSGLVELAPGQTVRLQVVSGKKGPEAGSVSLA
ncbi:MAG: cold-shock protein [Acetobacteraceae bacterium]